MSLKSIMGNAYKEGITLEEVEAFFEGNSKIVNLSEGKYVDKGKYDDVNNKYNTLVNDTKDYEDIKAKYQGLVEKQTKDSELSVINKYVKPEFAEYIHYQMKANNQLGDKLEDNVKAYLKTNSQYQIEVEKTEAPKRVINTYVATEGNGGAPKNKNDIINNAIRGAAGY